MRGIDWTILRAWKGSQSSAFEELCCQLAALEPIPGGEKFVRKGTPDAGVECYWTLAGGAEWAWQAKFFRETPSKSQWGDLADSVDTALRKHPRLQKHYICLPQDRADPRRDEAKHFMDRWDDHVEKWRELAAGRSMVVDFAYWGDHEIFQRLSREENRGRTFFWFERVAFSGRWLEQRIEEAVDAVGVRYTPELNVDLPIARLFDGLLRNGAFYERFKSKIRTLKRRYDKLHPGSLAAVSVPAAEAIRSSFRSLFEFADGLEPDLTAPIDLAELDRRTGFARRSLLDMLSYMERAKGPASGADPREGTDSSRREEVRRHDSYAIERVLDPLREVES